MRSDDSYLYLNRAFHPPPSVIRVKARHFHADIEGAPAEVLLVDGPLMIDEERHQAGSAVSRGKGHERESADPVAARHIVDFAARGVRPLPGENLIVIALIGSPPLAFDGISLLCSRGGEFTERTLVLAGRCRPVEAVSFSWSADKTPCVDAYLRNPSRHIPSGWRRRRHRRRSRSSRCGRCAGKQFPSWRAAY